MEVRRPRVVEVGARPLHAVLLDARVTDPVPVRTEVGELVPDVLRRPVLRPRPAERGRHRADDAPVLARFAGAVERLPHPVHPALGVREGAVLLGEARRREDDVRVLPGRVVQEDVLRDDELAAGEALLDVVGVRLGLGRVLADQVERLHAPVVEPGDDLVEPVARRLRHLHPPRLRELRAGSPGRRPAGSRAGTTGSRPSRSGPGRCSGRAARSARSTRSRGGRSSARGSRATRCCRRRRRARSSRACRRSLRAARARTRARSRGSPRHPRRSHGSASSGE